MRRLLLTLALLLTGIAYAAPALSLEWEEAEGSLDGRCIPALHRSFCRAPFVSNSDARLPGGERGARGTAPPRETAAPRRVAPTRVLIHRYNE